MAINNILIVFLFLCLNSYSQKIDSDLKNSMIKYLYERNELEDVDIKYLIDNKENKNLILFWVDEINVCCSNTLRAFKFGTSKEHSNMFIMLVKNKSEVLVLGEDFKKEFEENTFYNFVKFYDDDIVTCFYENILSKELLSIYKHNIYVSKISYVIMPQIFSDVKSN